MKTNTVLHVLCSALVARRNCIASNNTEWLDRHSSIIGRIARDFLPRGFGFDCGTKVDLDRSNGQTLVVLTTEFHHMNENGMYDGWTAHEVRIVPNLLHGFDLKISGRDRNAIKEYMHDQFSHDLGRAVCEFPDGEISSAESLNVSAT